MTTTSTTASALHTLAPVVSPPQPQLTVVGGATPAGHAWPGDIRDHMIHAHHRALVELMGEPRIIRAVHRFEHFEAGLGLVEVDHQH